MMGIIKEINIDKRILASITEDIKGVKKIIESKDMQKYRARKFRDYTVEMVSGGKLGIEKIKETTKKISGEHPPEWNSGDIVTNMSVRTMKGNAAGAGYFGDEPGKIAGKDITQTEAAILQHSGYRIPLTGEKGERVRKWLAWKGVLNTGMQIERSFYKPRTKSSSEKWIIVKPRPFLEISANHYIADDRDYSATNEYLDLMFR